ncbi:MAG: hypothetical protein ACRECJ_11225, partial [Limisphaerales bacterium]
MLKTLSAIEGLKTLSQTPSVVEGSKVEGKKLILPTLSLCCLLYGFEPVLAANAPADPEKKKQDSLRAVRLDKVATFRAVYPNVQIQANPVTGVPEDIWGDISK